MAGGYTDAIGDYHEGTEEWSETVPCRYEPNGSARTIPVGQGQDYRYEYTVYLNRDCPEIKFGQRVRIFNSEGELHGEFVAKGFHRGQLDAKLWV